MNRRRFLGAAVAIGAAGSGCFGITGPDPTIQDTTIEGGLLGNTEFKILVYNDGAAGEIRVTATVYDTTDDEVNSASTTEHFDGGQTRQVSVLMEVSGEAEYWQAEAENV